jgi:sugar (pentulose or hexulose) kinase
MKPDELILSIDCGTQSLKAVAFDLDGQVQAKARVAHAPYAAPHPGWAEKDPASFWEALCRACRQLWQDRRMDKAAVAGVALTTQRGTVVNVDARGRPLRPAILWLDQRKARHLPPIQGPWRWLFRGTGLHKTIAYFRAEAEANWIAAHQPDIWAQTHKYLLLSGYLTHRLTGEFKDSVGAQVGYIPFDYKKLRWASAGSWQWRYLKMQPDMLPELVPPTGMLGEISKTASSQTGIPAGLPLIAAAADKACEALGCGGLRPHIASLSYGTTATVNVTHPRYLEPIALLPAYPAALPGHHSVEVQVYRGYWMVNWFKEALGQKEQEMAARTGGTAEALFERLLEETPPGAMGLMLQPYWSPGLKSPGPEAKGAIIGFGDAHSRSHLYRSILEGLAYALREGKERIERRSRTAITSLRVSGGGSRSDQAMQLTADIFGLPALRPHLYDTAGLGAAIDAAVGLHFFPDVPAAVERMTHTGATFEPDPRHHRQYDALYRQVYKKMYRRLKPLYRKIREITGYPE